jgi:hypothetical protein
VYPSARRSSLRSFSICATASKSIGFTCWVKFRHQPDAVFLHRPRRFVTLLVILESVFNPAAQSCRHRRSASRDPDLNCSAEPTDAPQPPARVESRKRCDGIFQSYAGMIGRALACWAPSSSARCHRVALPCYLLPNASTIRPPECVKCRSPKRTVAKVLASERTSGKRLRSLRVSRRLRRLRYLLPLNGTFHRNCSEL